jgi:hypothetical protein
VETLILPSVCDDASLYVIATNCKRWLTKADINQAPTFLDFSKKAGLKFTVVKWIKSYARGENGNCES